MAERRSKSKRTSRGTKSPSGRAGKKKSAGAKPSSASNETEKLDRMTAARRKIHAELAERKQAEQKARGNLRRIEALRAIEQAISSSLDLQSVLHILLEKIEILWPFAAARTVRLLNRETGEFGFAACQGVDEDEWTKSRIAGRSRRVAATKMPLAILNVNTDPLTYKHEIFRSHGLVSYLGVPLIAKGEVLGVLGIYTREEHDFGDEEVAFLTTLATHAAVAIHNAQLYEQSKQHAADLEKLNKVRDEFLSVMSHELRTPLSVVTGYAGMIKDRLLGEINAHQEQALQKMLNRAADQLAMINDILQTSQIDARVVALEAEPVNIQDLFDQLKSDYEVRGDKKDVRLIWEYPAGAAPIRTDRAKLKQILQNLINNALKFTAEGSVTIAARVQEGDRREAAGNREDRGESLSAHASRREPALGKAEGPHAFVEFKVSDTGIGIPTEMHEQIFKKFNQVDSSETRLYGGVGLGLYIVKNFIDLLGGEIEVESEPGKGSTFIVKIPYST